MFARYPHPEDIVVGGSVPGRTGGAWGRCLFCGRHASHCSTLNTAKRFKNGAAKRSSPSVAARSHSALGTKRSAWQMAVLCSPLLMWPPRLKTWRKVSHSCVACSIVAADLRESVSLAKTLANLLQQTFPAISAICDHP